MFKMFTFCHSTLQWHLTERHTVRIVANGISSMACSIWSLSSSSVCGIVTYTVFFKLPQWCKSRGVKPGDRGGNSVALPLCSINLWLNVWSRKFLKLHGQNSAAIQLYHWWHVQSDLSVPPVFVVSWRTPCSLKFPKGRSLESRGDSGDRGGNAVALP